MTEMFRCGPYIQTNETRLTMLGWRPENGQIDVQLRRNIVNPDGSKVIPINYVRGEHPDVEVQFSENLEQQLAGD